MTAVFVHGVPETAAIWDGIRARLDGVTVALALPGFGAGVPDGFASTMDEYAAWLVQKLAAIGGDSIDVVGHDWGGILVTRVATTSGAALRSWVTDAPTVIERGFEWHDFAKIWQTPGEGEEFWEGLKAAPADAAALLVSMGVPDADAAAMTESLDDTMIASILALYRSATTIGQEWGTDDKPASPGMVLAAENDAFGSADSSRAAAKKLGARFELIPGAGHWWPYDSPDAGVELLTSFWSSVGD